MYRFFKKWRITNFGAKKFKVKKIEQCWTSHVPIFQKVAAGLLSTQSLKWLEL